MLVRERQQMVETVSLTHVPAGKDYWTMVDARTAQRIPIRILIAVSVFMINVVLKICF